MLLDISKLENDIYQHRLEEVSLKDVFEQIHCEVKQDIDDKNLSVSIDIPKDIPPLVSDAHVLHEIFSNIIGNAIRYTPSKGSIYITAAQTGGKVVVSVKDTGIGIPAKHQKEIYSQFFRADNAISMSHAGTGLGLYLVKQLVNLIRGDIDFISQHKKGTTFRVTLPTESKH